MPLTEALLALHRTGRVYADDVTLMDPRTGRTWPTLLPRDASSPQTNAAAADTLVERNDELALETWSDEGGASVTG